MGAIMVNKYAYVTTYPLTWQEVPSSVRILFQALLICLQFASEFLSCLLHVGLEARDLVALYEKIDSIDGTDFSLELDDLWQRQPSL